MVNAGHMAIRTRSENAVLQSTRFSFHSVLNGGVRADSGEPDTVPVKHYLTLPSNITPQHLTVYNYAFGSVIFFLSFISFVFIFKKTSLCTSKAEIRNTPGTLVELRQHMYLIMVRFQALSF